MEGMDGKDFEALPSFIKGLLKIEETEDMSCLEEDNTSDSEETSFAVENFVLFKNKENNYETMLQSMKPSKSNLLPLIMKNSVIETNKDKETSLTAESCIIKNKDNNFIFFRESDSKLRNERDKERNSEKTILPINDSQEMFSKHNSYVCFTYFDKNLNLKKSNEPPYCVIVEKYDSSRNHNDLKKLLELSESQNNNSQVYEPRRPRVKKSVAKKWSRREYMKTRNTIYEKISFRHDTGVIIWIPMVNCHVPLVHTLARKFGAIVMIHDRWIRDERNQSSKDSWGGVLVVYTTPQEAGTAKTEIPKKYSFVKTLILSEILCCLVNAELEHFEKENTDIFVNVPGQIPDESLHQIHAILGTFGEVISENSYQVIGQHSVRITTVYSCAAYAFLAMSVLDGLPLGEIKLNVELRETKRETAILKDLSFHLREYIGRDSFLFNGMW